MKSVGSTHSVAALSLSALLLVVPAFAQDTSGHAGHSSSGRSTVSHAGHSNTPAGQGYHAAMEKMHQQMMAKPMTGDADQDFVMMMLPHHQAATEMARVQLQHGADPELKRMSEKMIREQEEDIAELSKWMERHAK